MILDLFTRSSHTLTTFQSYLNPAIISRVFDSVFQTAQEKRPDLPDLSKGKECKGPGHYRLAQLLHNYYMMTTGKIEQV